MLVIGHRGANKEALENSWQAFEAAIEGGAERIELDVQLSRDGHPVVLHDDLTARTCLESSLISTLDRSDIERLSLKNGEKIPFLDEVLARLLPRVEINIEIKGPRPDLAKSVGALVKNHPLRERVIVSSFYLEPLAWFRDSCDGIARACLLARDHLIWPQVALRSPLIFLNAASAGIFHPEMSMVDENFMDQCQSRGIKVYTWASMASKDDHPEGLWKKLKELHVDGHCTNDPRKLKLWLKEAF